ncbi:MAG: response regulator [Deltaproteobacteria bacterium]|nr:response regulator [Deltaproteobacteria bacterium]
MAEKGFYNILTIDDDRSIRELLTDSLAENGYNAEAVGDGKKAIEIIKNKGFDCIVVDLKMPGMTGIDILKSVKLLDPDAMVIIMTGYASLDTAVQAIREWAYDYIIKPFRLDEMHITVRNASPQAAEGFCG